MPQQPVPADPGRDDDLAWLDRDPATAAEREAWLDRVCEDDEPPEPEEYGDFAPLTAEELAEIREAAADELLAVEAAAAGRRGPGQPGSARVFPGESSSPAAGFGPGMALDVLPGCAGLAAAADAAGGGEDGFAGVSEAELVGVCAPGTGSRRTPPPASWPRSPSWSAAIPAEAERGVHRRPAGLRPGRVPRPRRRPAGPRGFSRHPAARHEGGAAGRDHLPVQGRDHRSRHRAAGPRRGARRRGQGAGPGGPADPGRAARRDRPRRHGGGPGQGEGTAGDRGAGTPGWSGGPRIPATPR